MENPDCVEPGSGRLAPELAAGLEPKLQDALDHLIRREILRRLKNSREGQALPQLTSELAPISITQVNYHLHVLARSGVVAPGPRESVVGGPPQYELSVLGDDAKVEAVLSATEGWDRERRGALGGDMAALRQGPGDE